ncbi:MAG: carboxymuconolactone decarboxylase family protein [Methanotrichaceae archaeon]|nr:carboxymuconolactone decarboxylase family protein [Methanotrichaceae archaeon]
MSGLKLRPFQFTEAVGEDVDQAFKKLASEINKDGALSAKDKSLIALACAVALKCEYCIKAHKEAALLAGANQKEMLEAAAVAGLVRMGSGFTYASYLLDE